MGVGRCRLSKDLFVAPLPWLSMLPVGDDCADRLKGRRVPDFRLGRSLLDKSAVCTPLFWATLLEYPGDSLDILGVQPLASVCRQRKDVGAKLHLLAAGRRIV